ncbi:DsbA family oxidoreductase [Streptomyces albipurpureus]|uniref:DsbA family oxidoreductase n=1 Tax=Streptomyces albipurpureus TaxID=2897419 RepID=A0ABT0UXG5_9ACTN|nr:DsbA family oxidoreductase [Streptomyces sp. CWNU-1]MCM2393267.1 DsbA family oxidoreductase [Streptomyces sp. CWNU-1]
MSAHIHDGTITVEVYADIVCPWCYIGKRRLDRALEALPEGADVRVVHRPFQLDPGAPRRGTLARDYLSEQLGPRAEAVLAHTTRLAASEGIAMDFGRALIGNTFDAHRVLWLAGNSGSQAAVKERVFAAYFTQGLDITRPEVLAAAAAPDLDPERVLTVLAGSEGVPEVTAQLTAARASGIRSVPSVTIDGGPAIEGALETSVLLDALERAHRESAARVERSAAGDGTPTGGGGRT